MPSGVYIRTEKHKQKLKGKIPWNKNKTGIYSSETKLLMRIAKLGTHQSEETIEKRRRKLTGLKRTKRTKRKLSKQKIGDRNPMKRLSARIKSSESHKGKHQSIKTRIKRSKSLCGEKCHLWKGGITEKNQIIRTSLKFRLWRKAVFTRDNWTCQKTRTKGGKLNAHHIKSFSQYPELRFKVSNGITLLEKVHKNFHKIYGHKNNTKKQLYEYVISS